MTNEKRLMNEIRVYCGEKGWVVVRANVGKVMMANGKWFDTGLPKGWPDLMILTGNGHIMFCETKIRPNRPTKEQEKILKRLRSLGYNAFIAYDLEDFKRRVVG